MNTSACQRLNVLLSVLAATTAIFMASPAARAATKTWNNAGTVWVTAGDWTGGAPTNDLTTDIALFNSTLFSNQPNYGITSVNGIQVGDGTTVTGPLALTGTALTLGSGGITIAANAGTVSLANSVLIGSNQSWTNNSSSLFTVGATITNLGNVTPFTLTLKGSGSGGTALTGIISDGGVTGTTALTVNTTGSGVTTLSGANTYTGVTTLTSGILRATTSASALGAGTLSLGGGELQLANASGTNLSFNRNTTVTGNTQITSDLTASGAANTYTLGTLAIGAQQLNIRAGSNVTSGTAGVTFGTTTLSASGTVFDVGSNANLTLNTLTGAFNFWKQNSGTLTLASTSGTRATGATFLTGGTLVMGGTGNGTTTDSLGSAAAPTINLFNGTTLDLAIGIAAGTSVAAHPTNIYGNTTILSDANTASTAGFTHTLGALTVLGPDTLTIGKGGNVSGGTPVVAFGAATINAATTFSVNTGSQLTLNSTLIETGNGTITFGGAGNSTVTGIISGGGGLTMSGTGLLTLTAANTYTGANNISAGMVTLGNATSLGVAATAVLNMSGTGTLNTNNLSPSLLALNDSSTTAVIQNGGSTTASTLTVTPAANTTSTFAGTIQDGGGTKTQAVTVNGNGALSLSGNNTYTGGTTLTAGQLNINSATALGTGTLTVTTGILDNTSGSDVTLTNNNNVTLGATAYSSFGGSGNLSFGSGTATLTTTYSLYLMGTGGKALSFGTWNDNMAISTTRIYAMPGSNSTVNFGKYISTNNASAGTIAGNANITITGGIQPGVSTASVVYSSAGTLTLSGTSNYTGATTFNGGTVILDNTGGSTTFSSSSAPTFAGGTFIYKGASAGSNQTLGNVTLSAGASSIQVVGGTSGTTTLTLGTMTDATNNAMLNINLSGTGAAVTTSTTNTAGIFGTRGAVTVTTGGTTEFATASGTSLGQYTGQTPFTGTTTGTTTNYSVADSQTLTTAASTPNSIKITTTANNGSLDLGANTMKITSGGILFTGANTGYQIKGTNAAALSSATLTNSDLIIHNFGTGGLTISAVIANGVGIQVLSLDGTGVTTLSGVNTYTGVTQAGGGAVVNISADSGLGAVATGAALTLNNATLQAGATFALDNSSGTGTNARAITLNTGGGTFDTQANTLTISGVISGAGSLTKAGTGTLILSGINTFTGGFTNIQNGTAVIGTKTGSTVGLLTASTMVTLGSGANSGVLQLGDSGNAAPQTIAGLFTLGSGSTNAVVGGNASNSTLTFAGSVLTPSTFNGSLGGAGSNNNNLALAVTTGQLTLGGASTYTGPTTVTGGVLNINNNAALGASTLAVNLATAVIDNTSGSAKTMTNNNNVTTTTGFVFGGSNNLSFGSGTLSTTLAATPIPVWGNSTLTFG